MQNSDYSSLNLEFQSYVKSKFLIFPIPKNNILSLYYDFIEEKGRSNNDLDYSEIYESTIQWNFIQLYDKIWKYSIDFVEKIGLRRVFDIEKFSNYLIYDIIIENFSLEKLLKNNLKNMKEEKILNITEKISLIITNMVEMLGFLIKYIEKVLNIFQYEEIYRGNILEMITKIEEILLNQMKNSEKEINTFLENEINKIIVKLSEFVNCELEINLKSNDNLEDFFSFKKNYKSLLQEMFNEEIKNNLGIILPFFISKTYLNKLCVLVDEKMEIKFQKLISNSKEIELRKDYILETINNCNKEGLFNFKNNNIEHKQILYNLICLTISTNNDSTFFLFHLEYINFMKNKFFSNCKPIYHYLYKDYESFKANSQIITNELDKNKLIWREKVCEDLNIYSIICLLLSCYYDKDKINLSISLANRNHIISILRNLQNGKYGYLNFQLFFYIEKLLKNTKNDDYSSKILNSLRLNDNSQIVLFLTELLEKKPLKFEFERLSTPETLSNIINICISGFQSQDTDKHLEWSLLKQYDINMELFTLKWHAFTYQSTMDFLLGKFSEFTSMKSILGFNPFFKYAIGGYCLINALKENPFTLAYNEAVNSGIFLAKCIAEKKIFINHGINLIGFSMGTIVIFECLLELERLNCLNFINDVIVMGGIINCETFKTQKFRMINGKFINCFSKNDNILQILFRVVKLGEVPIGIKEINYHNSKVFNYDCSDLIDEHMDYRKKMDKILKRIDFNSDFNIFN